MVQKSFRLSINEVRAENLVGKNSDGTSDPYAKFNFAGDYKMFKTETLHKDLNPEWDFSLDFYYHTAYAHKLDRKYLVVKVADWNKVKTNVEIGSAKVDLHTLATGPSQVQLDLVDEGKITGRLFFNLEMVEVCKKASVTLSQLAIPAWTPPQVAANTQIAIDFHYSENEGKSVRSPSVPLAAPRWNQLNALDVMGEFTEFEQAQIVIQILLIDVHGRATEYASCRVPFLKYYQVGNVPTPFQEPLMFRNPAGAVQQIGILHGQFLCLNGPTFAQMIGGKTTSQGVEPGVSTGAGMPVPKNLLADAPVRAFGSENIVHPPTPAARASASGDSLLPPQAAQVRPRSPSSAAVNAQYTQEAFGSQDAQYSQEAFGSQDAKQPRAFNFVQPKQQQQPAQPQQQVQRQQNRAGFATVAPVVAQSTTAVAQTVKAGPRLKREEDDWAPLPRGWGMATNRQNQVYFKYHRTRRTAWQDPRFLPSGWEQHVTQDGKLYFSHLKSKQNTWMDPRGLPDNFKMLLKSGDAAAWFQDKESKHQTRCDPRALPKGFTQHTADAQGKLYFKNHSLKKSQWDDPRRGISAQQQQQERRQQRKDWELAHFAEVRKQHEEEEAAKHDDPIEEERTRFLETMATEEDDIFIIRKRWQKDKEKEWATLLECRELHEKDQKSKLAAAQDRQEDRLRVELESWQDDFMVEFRRQRQLKVNQQETERRALTIEQDAKREGMSVDRTSWEREFNERRAKEIMEQDRKEQRKRKELQQKLDEFQKRMEKFTITSQRTTLR